MPWLECTWELEKDINDDLKIAQFHRVNRMPTDPVPNIDSSLRPTFTAHRPSTSKPRLPRNHARREVIRRLLPKRGGLALTSGLDALPQLYAQDEDLVYGPTRAGRAGRPPSVIATGLLQRALLVVVAKLALTQK